MSDAPARSAPSAPSAPSEVTLELRRPYLALGAATAFFLAPSLFFLHRAATNDRGLILDGILPLSVDAASVFYAILALLGLGLVVMGTLGLVKLSRRSTYRLSMRETGITLPDARAWRANEDVTVAWRDLVSVQLGPDGKPKQITLRARSGVHAVHRRVLPPEWSIERLAQLITERWRAS